MIKLVIILCFFIFSSCSSKRPVSETSFKLSLGAFLSDAQFEGGVLVRAIDLVNGVVRDHQLINNRSLEFDNGRWQFLVVAFQSADLATPLCASSAPMSLEGKNVTVSLNLSQAACLNAPFDIIAEEIKFDYFIKPPTAPLNLTAIYNGTSMDLTWATPVSNGGDPITDYQVEVSINLGAWNTLSISPPLNYNHTGITVGESYRYRVAAINSKGLGAYSDFSEVNTGVIATQLAIVSGVAPTITAGDCQVYILESQNSLGDAMAVDSNLVITLGASAGSVIYNDDNCGVSGTEITLLSGQSTISFSFMSETSGAYTITGNSALGSINDTVDVFHGAPATMALTSLDAVYEQGDPISLSFTLYDAFGNIASTYDGSFTVDFAFDPTSGSASVTGGVAGAINSGSGLTSVFVDYPMSSYQLRVNASGVFGNSTEFEISMSCNPALTPFGNNGFGTGTTSNPHTLCHRDQLTFLDGESAHFHLLANIDMESYMHMDSGALIPTFSGVLEGNGFMILGLMVYEGTANADPVGLFGSLTGAQISNLSFDAPSISGVDSIALGILAGVTDEFTVIDSVHVLSGEVTGSTISGGLVGANSGQISSSSAFSIYMVDGVDTGGLVGVNHSSGIISQSYTTGLMSTSDGVAVGGLVGRNSGVISDSYSTAIGNGMGLVSTGGLVGVLSVGATITNSFAIGIPSTDATYAGALIGTREGGGVTASFFDSEITALLGVANGTQTGVDGLLTADFATQANFQTSGWSFPGVWTMDGTRPKLSWE